MSVAEAAAHGGVSEGTLKRELARQAGKGPAPSRGGKADSRAVAGTRKGGSRVVATPLAKTATDAPTGDGEAAEEGDLLDILRRELAYARRARASATTDPARAKWSKRIEELVRAVERLAPPPVPSPDAVQAELQRYAGAALALIEENMPDRIAAAEVYAA